MRKQNLTLIALILALSASFTSCTKVDWEELISKSQKEQEETPPTVDEPKEDDRTSYLLYSSLLSQKGTSAPTEEVLTNEPAISIKWKRVKEGVFKGTLSEPVDTEKASVIITMQETDRYASGGFTSPTTIEFHSVYRYNVYEEYDEFENTIVEIKLFKE